MRLVDIHKNNFFEGDNSEWVLSLANFEDNIFFSVHKKRDKEEYRVVSKDYFSVIIQDVSRERLLEFVDSIKEYVDDSD